VSGGADSVALLLLLLDCAGNWAFVPSVVTSSQIGGKASDRTKHLSRNCRKHGLGVSLGFR